MLPCRHAFMPYVEAAQHPNIVVDGAANESSVLTLSHWPKSGTPWPLKADTSVEVVFNYLDQIPRGTATCRRSPTTISMRMA